MKINRRWLWIGGAAAAAAGALALGVPLSTLLIVGALLACPVMMSLGMRGMHQGSDGQSAGGMAGCSPGMHESKKEQPRVESASTEPRDPGEPARRG